MAEYGCDEKAVAVLQNLSVERQQECLAKLVEAMNAGKVKNPSGYLVGICNGPDGCGIDERARQLLKELPKPMQDNLLNRLRTADNIQNPSAWMAQAVLKAKREGTVMGMSGMGGMGGMDMWANHDLGLDERAWQLLAELPKPMQDNLLNRLRTAGNIHNPSAWIAQAVLKAKREGTVMGGGMGGMAKAAWEASGMPNSASLDDKAKALLQSLPIAAQQELVTFLDQKANVTNPSAWMAKAAIAAGAQPIKDQLAGSGVTSVALDAQAEQLLASLPPVTQDEIRAKLHNSVSAGQVANASAWVAKACLKAGATSTPGAGKAAAMKQGFRSTPY